MSKRQSALLRTLQSRHGRKRSEFCRCEGVRCCSEVYARNPELVCFSVATAERAAELAIPGELVLLSENELREYGETVNMQGVVAVVKRPETAAFVKDECTQDFIPVLDQVGDPGNFGTILRTAKAAGLNEVWYTAGSVDPYNDKVIRSALSAQFSMNLRCFDNLEALRQFGVENGYPAIFLTDPHRGENCFTAEKLFFRSLVVIGSEGHGVSEVLDAQRVTIPMPGNFESLNAAQAATIFIFEYVRRVTK
ncbi:MAG: RNA methyltransferase [Victivallaceae bacterium]